MGSSSSSSDTEKQKQDALLLESRICGNVIEQIASVT
jgi:hypothetical protein